MADSLPDVIQRAIDTYPWGDRARVTMPAHLTDAVRAAGYKSPKEIAEDIITKVNDGIAEIAAVLDAEEADCRADCEHVIAHLRAALLGTEEAS